MQKSEGNRTKQVWWTSRRAKKQLLRKSAAIQARDLGESQAARSRLFSFLFFFSPLLFPPFSLHTVQMKTLVIFSKGKCLRKQVEFKRHCRTALPTLLQTFPEQLLCPLISSELQSGFAWYKHLRATGSQELCSFSVITAAQPECLHAEIKLVALLQW